MAERPVFHPDLGTFFEELRTGRGWNQKQAADMARRRRLPRLTRQVLLRLEGGKTKWPDPNVLRDVAALYELPYERLVARVVRYSYGLDLSGERKPKRQKEPGISHVPLLEDRIAAGFAIVIDEHRREEEPVPFRREFLDRLRVDEPLCIRVGDRELSMVPTIQPGALVLLDCSAKRRVDPSPNRIYAVHVDDHGAVLKRVFPMKDHLLLVSDNPDKVHYPAREVRTDMDTQMTSPIVGEVMWTGEPPV